MNVITRFAPSPTGNFHIGSARTALFNWLYTKHYNGKYLLRIEDTDRKRSTKNAINNIINSLNWLGIIPDEKPIIQFTNKTRHQEIAKYLLEKNMAYYCYNTIEELIKIRTEFNIKKIPYKFNSKWRNNNQAPSNITPVIRFKSPQSGITTIKDLIQGNISIKNNELDDIIILRADGTPTYMLSVITDDHDMGITHIIRGNDHLTNTFKQQQIYKALEWKIPQFAHIPLIHDTNGTKLSKRQGALSIEQYKKMGFVSKAMCNYLLRLGWAYKNEEIISQKKAISLFNIKGIVKSPANFDIKKLTYLNNYYIKTESSTYLVNLVSPIIINHIKRNILNIEKKRILKGMHELKIRIKTLKELSYAAEIYLNTTQHVNKNQLINKSNLSIKYQLIYLINSSPSWEKTDLENIIRKLSKSKNIQLKIISQDLRKILTGRIITPGIFEVMSVLERKESIKRIKNNINDYIK